MKKILKKKIEKTELKQNKKKNIDIDTDTFLTGTSLIQQKREINPEKSTESKGSSTNDIQKSQNKTRNKKNYNNIYINNFNNKFFKNKDQKVMTVLEKAENAYNLIKSQIDNLLSKEATDNEEEISEENTEMLEYFNQLNKIVSFLSDNSKIPAKLKKTQKQEKIVDPSINNEKILNM